MSTALTKTELLEARIDKGVAAMMPISNAMGGVSFSSMGEVMEFSKIMAIAGTAVPPHLRNQAGTCLAIIIQAIEWRMSPYAVANKSYVVNDRVAYESQLIHAVIEQRAPLIGRLKNRFIGEGDTRQCIVWANVRGEDDPLEYTSSQYKMIQPKNSPLWKTKPDLQLFYNASRDWARMYFPDVILGVYAEDELPTRDVGPAIHAQARITSLNELTDRITRPEQAIEPPAVVTQEPTAEKTAIEQPAADPAALADLSADLAKCTDLTSVTLLEESYEKKPLSADQQTELAGRCEERREAIRNSRGSRKS